MEVAGWYVPTWLAITLPLLYLWYRNVTKNFGTFKRLGIKGPRPYPFIGTMYRVMGKGMGQADLELKQRYGDVVGTFMSRNPLLVVFDKDMLRQILVKEFANFPDRLVILGLGDYGVRKMITLLKGDDWRHIRATVSPTFSSGRLRGMVNEINRCTNLLVKNLETTAENEVLELNKHTGAFTMDVIARTAFGIDLDSQNDPNNEFVRHAKAAFTFSFKSIAMILLMFAPFLVKYVGFFPKASINFFVKVINEAIDARKESGKRNDFLQLMMNAHNDDPTGSDSEDDATEERGTVVGNRGLTREEIVGQSLTFFIAGYETTANTIGFVIYSLACNPGTQDRLLSEIEKIMEGHDEPTYELIREMTYLDMVVQETLRLYPLTHRTDRVTLADTTINGQFIPKDMLIGIPIFALQRDPDVWPEPDKFDPERFTAEAKASRHAFSHMPFSLGPRSCVAMRLALLEVKLAVVKLLLRYRFVTCEETEIPIKLDDIISRPKNGIKLKIVKRH